MNVDHTKIAVGKYLVSPLAKQQGEGFAASDITDNFFNSLGVTSWPKKN
jgi:hypothetical protein